MWLYHVQRPLKPALRRFWRLSLEGAIEFIPRRGPLIVAPNHSSFLDPWFLAWVFPRSIRYLVTDDWCFRNPLWWSFFAAHGCIPLRSGNPAASVRAACAALAKGATVGVFPEGRISGDGRIQSFQAGIALLAARSGAPVLPVGVRGAFDSLPRTRKIPRRVPVRIHVGAPVSLTDAWDGRRLNRTAADRFVDHLFREVQHLSGQAAPQAQVGPMSAEALAGASFLRGGRSGERLARIPTN